MKLAIMCVIPCNSAASCFFREEWHELRTIDDLANSQRDSDEPKAKVRANAVRSVLDNHNRTIGFYVALGYSNTYTAKAKTRVYSADVLSSLSNFLSIKTYGHIWHIAKEVL